MTTHAFDNSSRSPGSGDAPIPRISIEAFCDTQAFADAIEEASRDRRMAKASVAVNMGGVDRAIDVFSDSLTPNLLIVESSESGFGIFQELEELADVCDPNTKIIVAGPSNDVTLYRELMRQGVDEYIVSPAAPMQVIDAIGAVFSDPKDTPLARMIGVVGAKGGVGASTIAHNIASQLAKNAQRSVILLDLDVEFGTAGLDFNQEPTRTIADALVDADDLDDVKLGRLLIEHSPNLKLLAAPASLDQTIDIDEASALQLLEAVKRSADIVVADIPHTWSAWVRQCVLQMDEIVLIAGPDLASLRNAKNMYETLVQRRANDTPPKIILNQVGMAKRPEIPMKDFADILGKAPDVVIPFDGVFVVGAANSGQMLHEANPQHKIVADLDKFVGGLTGGKAVTGARREKAGLGGFLAGFGKLKGAMARGGKKAKKA